MSANGQASTGYRHLNNRNLSVFNEFSKQLKGEAKRYVLLSISTHHYEKPKEMRLKKKNQCNRLIAIDVSLDLLPCSLASGSLSIDNYAYL